jgi:multidrug resistance efflux pump
MRRAATALALVLLLTGCERGSAGSGRVVSAVEEDLVLDVEVAGSLKALESQQVGPPAAVTDFWNFKITRLIAEGTKVEPGEEVVAFDESDLEKDLTDQQNEVKSLTEELGKLQAENTLTVLDDRLARADAEARRHKAELKADLPPDLTAQIERKLAAVELTLAQKEVAFRVEREQAKRQQEHSERAILAGRLQRARAAVADIQVEIKAMAVKAQRPGTVVYTQNSQGEKKKVGDRTSRSESVLQIAKLSQLAAQGQVDEVDASHVAAGQRVGLRLEAHPEKEYSGVVERVASLVQTESAESRVKVVQLDIKLAQTDPVLMRPGMRFRGRIEIARVHGVVQLPLTAIVSTASGPVVTRVGPGGSLRAVAVQLGRRSRQMVEIKAGLKAGERVLLEPGARAGQNTSGGFGLGAS